MLEDRGVVSAGYKDPLRLVSLSLRYQLLRNYTQNIDTLESLAGVTRVLQCHGEIVL